MSSRKYWLVLKPADEKFYRNFHLLYTSYLNGHLDIPDLHALLIPRDYRLNVIIFLCMTTTNLYNIDCRKKGERGASLVQDQFSFM